MNRYAYVLNNPTNLADPSGLCALVVAGVGDTKDNSPEILAYAEKIGANVAFPYANTGTIGGTLSVLGQDLGLQTSAEQVTAAAITASANDPNGSKVSVVTFSGGAQSFSSALGDVQQNINVTLTSAVYVEPGTGLFTGLLSSGLPHGSGQSAILRGHGFLEGLFGAITRGHGIPKYPIGCGHDAKCAFGLLNSDTAPVQPKSAAPCSNRQGFTPNGTFPLNGGGAGGSGPAGGGSGGDWGSIFVQPFGCNESGCSFFLGVWIYGVFDPWFYIQRK